MTKPHSNNDHCSPTLPPQYVLAPPTLAFRRTQFPATTKKSMSRTQTRLHDLALSSFRRKHNTTTFYLLRAANLYFRALYPSSFDPHFTHTLDAIGLEALVWGDPSHAERCFRASLTERKRTLPLGHWMITESTVHLAQALGVQGRLNEAEELLRWSVAWHAERRGSQHKESREVMWLLARLLEETGRCGEALGLYEECYVGALGAVGEHHVDTREYWGDYMRLVARREDAEVVVSDAGTI